MEDNNIDIKLAVTTFCMIAGAAAIEYYGTLVISKAVCKIIDKIHDKISKKEEA